jgi:hypothetical protein
MPHYEYLGNVKYDLVTLHVQISYLWAGRLSCRMIDVKSKSEGEILLRGPSPIWRENIIIYLM